MSWFPLAVFSFVAFGAQNYLYKLSAIHDLSTRAVTLSYIVMSTAVLWCIALTSSNPIAFTPYILLLGALDAVCYYTTTISRIEALRYVPTNIAFPIVRMSTIVVVLYAVIRFGEPFTWQLGGALLIVFVVLYMINSERHIDLERWPRYGFGIVLSIVAMVSSAGTNIISKLASATGALTVYMTTANTLIVGLCIVDIAIKRNVSRSDWNRNVLGIGALIAITNLIAWYAYLEALAIGSLGIVATVASLAFVVPIFLSAMFHEEDLSPRRIMALLLTCAALGLLYFEPH